MMKISKIKKIKKMTLWLLCMSLVCGSIVSVSAAETTAQSTDGNLLENPGFEESSYVNYKNNWNWGSVTENWYTPVQLTTSDYELKLTDDAHSGEKAFSVTIKTKDKDFRLYGSGADGTSTTPTKGNYTGLEANTEYIASIWAKGTTTLKYRYYKKATDSTEVYGDGFALSENDWKLVTYRFTPYESGEYNWCFRAYSYAAGDYAIFDDAQLVTKAQAIENVEAMINDLDVSASSADRAIADIEQWCSVLGSENISNYSDFLSKTSGEYQYVDEGNKLANPGFEESTEVKYAGGWKNVTENWITAYELKSSNYVLALTDDTHSGEKALSVTMKSKGTEFRLYGSGADATSTTPAKGNYTGLEANTEYIASIWAKGTTTLRYRYFGKATDTDQSFGDEYPLSEDDWKLVTYRFTPYESGEYNWCFRAYSYAAGDYAIFDDAQLVTKAQAITNVEAMIDALDVNSSNAERAIADIEQWCAVLGSDKITNYGKFVSKKLKEDPLILEYTYTKYSEVSDVKDITPKGYIFTGWFTSNDVKTEENMKKYALSTTAEAQLTDDSTVYARFVGATMLDVKAQLSAGTTASSTTTNMRFLTTIDNLAYQKIGFKITIGSKTVDSANNNVYSNLSATYISGEQKVYTPDMFYKNSTYYKAATITNIPSTGTINFSTEITVVPYIVTLDGTTVEGTSVTKTVNQGITAITATN